MFSIQSNNPFICGASQLHYQASQQRTYLGKSLCRRQTLCIPVKTLAKRRWLMSNGIAEGWMETTSLEKVSIVRPDSEPLLTTSALTSQPSISSSGSSSKFLGSYPLSSASPCGMNRLSGSGSASEVVVACEICRPRLPKTRRSRGPAAGPGFGGGAISVFLLSKVCETA